MLQVLGQPLDMQCCMIDSVLYHILVVFRLNAGFSSLVALEEEFVFDLAKYLAALNFVESVLKM